MEYSPNRSATMFELSRHVEIARTCLRQVGNQVCDQVCDLDSLAKTSRRPGREPIRVPGRELDSVMEFAKFRYTIQLATRSRACLRPASELVR